jgi:3-oxoadipyl-CoA thiolase
MTDAFLVGGVRTPFGRYRGALADSRPDDLAALVLGAALERAGVPLDAVDEVIFGAANQAGEDNRNVARMAALLAGLPDEVPGYTVNRLCASSLQAVASAAQQIRSGEADVVVAGGVESMTRAPMVLPKSPRPWAAAGDVADTTLGWRLVNPRFKDLDGGKATISLGETAEEVAVLDGISREDSDAWGLRSQQLTAEHQDRLALDFVSVETGRGEEVATDEVPRADTSAEALAKLKPAFTKNGTVTAGNAAGVNDAAAAVVVIAADTAQQLGTPVRARILSWASCGVEPKLMGIGPVPAVRKALQRAGRTLEDVDVIELNEAFAAQSLGCLRQLGIADDDPRVNPNGGAIALGHPLGMSGARILLSAAHELVERKARYALCTMCIGVGQGMAVIIERA